MKANYYIGEKMATVGATDLKSGARIILIEDDSLYIDFKDFDGPYQSLEELKKKSSIFKKLTLSDPQRVQQILENKNIFSVKNMIFTEIDKKVTFDFMKLLDHTIRGKIKSKKMSGIHYFDKDRMKIKQILEKKDKNFVWKAIVYIYDKKNNQHYEKESNFFPANWSLTQLFHECDHAFLNKIKDTSKRNIYNSQTTSGVPVKIIIEDNKVKSIYPIHLKDTLASAAL